ncbi:MAG: cysteine hydrolase family protein [Anaerostipes sp.]|jgi:nicotinamidase/pyrazinamidase
MKKILVVVDMQNDFIDGTLGTKEAQSIVPKVCDRIRSFSGEIYGTLDTHKEDYMETQEGKNLPVVHCIAGEEGWALNQEVMDAIFETKAEVHEFCRKDTFGSKELARMLEEKYQGQDLEITFIGLCTDICVISNAMCLKAVLPEAKLIVDASCCAGVTPESHKNALEAMKVCQIQVI